MLGVLQSRLKRYVSHVYGEEVWERALVETGHRGVYWPWREYPDQEFLDLAEAVARLVGKSVTRIHEEFGRFIVPGLFLDLEHVFHPSWHTLDHVEHFDRSGRRLYRAQGYGEALPYELTTTRVSPEEVRLDYRAPTRLCGLLKGVALGIAEHRKEAVQVEEPECLWRGADRCVITVRAVDGRPSLDG